MTPDKWALLDTFDMLAPAFDTPQEDKAIRSWLQSEQIEKIVRRPNPGLNLVGTKSEPRGAAS